MPYNIDSIDIIDGALYINDAHIAEAVGPTGFEFVPETCFVANPTSRYSGCIEPGTGRIRDLGWYGEGSGHSYPILLGALRLCTGRADIIICWEGGDAYTGLRVDNGKVTEHEVKMTLGDPKDPT